MLVKQLNVSTAIYAVFILAFPETVLAQSINTGATVNVSSIGGGTPAFDGGTLVIDKSGTYTNNFTLQGPSITNTIDAHGNAATFSGIYSDLVLETLGSMTVTDTVGGGRVTLSGVNTFTGTTTVNAGATLAVSGAGSIANSNGVSDNGTFDISAASAQVPVESLAGSGTVNLGAQSLRITAGATVFTGTIAGTGSLTVSGGTETLDGANTYTGGTTIASLGTLAIGNVDTNGSIMGNVLDNGAFEFNRTDTINFAQTISGAGVVIQSGGVVNITLPQTYTGATTINAGTLALSGSGSLASSQGVAANGTFDISATTGASIRSLSGSGSVALGAETLTITNGNGNFSGTISGTGALVVSGGTEYLSGTNSYTGGTTVTAGTLQLGSGGPAGSVVGNIANSGTVNFSYSGAVSFGQTISGNGGVAVLGGTLTVTTPQTYTGPTTITAGTLALSGSGSIAASQGVTSSGTFDISATTGASIASLSGGGSVQLGAQTLTLVNASGTFSGFIAGAGGGLTVAGGNETLLGVNSYTGLTTIASSATLTITGVSALATSSGVVDNGVLDISGARGLSNTATNVATTTLGGSGTVVLGANTLQLAAAAGTFSGSISGTGGLTLSAGNETLTGQSSYSGPTTISAGTLFLAGGGSLSPTTTVAVASAFDISAVTTGSTTAGSLSGSGTVNLGGNSLNLANGASNFSGTISGTGGLVVSGGTQILSGSNSYTGGTATTTTVTLAGTTVGTLQLGNGGTTGSILGNVADGGVLAFDYSGSATFTGTITGSGQVNQAGLGTTVLTAANTYSGGTLITSGTLQIGNGATAGSITGNVTDSGTLAFDRSDAIVFGGTISGSGGIAQIGAGNVTLTAANTYSGTTTIASTGTLTLGAAGSIANSSSVVDNGLLNLSAATAPQLTSLAGTGTVSLGSNTLLLTNAADVFSGTIAGTGGLTLSGGSQTLAGTNSYTGATTVNGGSLKVTGSIAQSNAVIVNSGGTLAGTGTTSAVTVNSGGTLAPGVAGAGTLTVNGAVSFANGSTFLINNSSASAPKLAVSGPTALAGTIAVASTNGSLLLGQQTTVLTATGGVTGSFTPAAVPASASGAQFASAVTYDNNDVYLEIKLAKLSPALPSGASLNQVNAVAGIDAAIAAGNTLPASFESLGTLTQANLNTASQQLAGELAGDMTLIDNALFNPFLDAIFDQLDDEQQSGPQRGRGQTGVRVWASGLTGDEIAAENIADGSHKFSSTASGFIGGADWRVSPRLSLGGALSAGSSDFHLAGNFGTGRATALQLGLYGIVQLSSRIYGSFAGIFGQDNVTTDRIVTISGSDDLTGKVKSNVFGGRYETGITLKWLTPYVAVEEQLVTTPAYAETASSGNSTFALNYGSHTSNTPDIEAGFRQSTGFPVSRNWTLDLSDRLAWEHAAPGSSSALANFVALPASQFTAYGAQSGKDSALISLGTDLHSNYGLSFNVHFESAVSAKSQSYDGIGGLTFAW